SEEEGTRRRADEEYRGRPQRRERGEAAPQVDLQRVHPGLGGRDPGGVELARDRELAIPVRGQNALARERFRGDREPGVLDERRFERRPRYQAAVERDADREV